MHLARLIPDYLRGADTGEIAAGYLPIDLRFRGQAEHGWNALMGLKIVGGIATTRRFIAAHRPLVAGFVKGVVDAIHLFKTRPDIVIPLLQEFLADAPTASRWSNSTPSTRRCSAPCRRRRSLRRWMACARVWPGNIRRRGRCEMEDVADSSFVEELEGSGYIDELVCRLGLMRCSFDETGGVCSTSPLPSGEVGSQRRVRG